jgi:hypothetical protein
MASVREEGLTPELLSASTIKSRKHLRKNLEEEKIPDLVESYTIKSCCGKTHPSKFNRHLARCNNEILTKNSS